MLNLSDLIFLGLVLSIVALSPFVEKAKLPTSALVIIVGVLIGPAGFSLLAFTEGIRLFSELAIVLILFYAGLEVQWHRFVIALRPGFYVALAGIVLSALLGMAVSLSFDSNMEQALYIGAALAATSIGLSVPLLKQANLLHTRMGQILLAAAIIDDVLAMYFLSVLHTSLSAQGDLGRLAVGLIIGALVLIFIALLNAVLATLLKKTFFDGRVVLVTGLLFIGALASGAVTWAVDMSLAVGAFLSGAVMAWSGIGQKYRVPTHIFERLFSVATPAFFFAIGLQITAISFASNTLWVFAIAITVAAIAGKLLSAWVVPLALSARDRWVLGTALIPRGEVGLIIAGLGLKQAHLNHHAMMALVVMTVITAIVAAVFVPVCARTKWRVPVSTPNDE